MQCTESHDLLYILVSVAILLAIIPAAAVFFMWRNSNKRILEVHRVIEEVKNGNGSDHSNPPSGKRM